MNESIRFSIKSRFDQPGYAMHKNLESLLVTAANGKNFEEHFTLVTALTKIEIFLPHIFKILMVVYLSGISSDTFKVLLPLHVLLTLKLLFSCS